MIAFDTTDDFGGFGGWCAWYKYKFVVVWLLCWEMVLVWVGGFVLRLGLWMRLVVVVIWLILVVWCGVDIIPICAMFSG